jgi:hypothetical protein
MVKPDNNKNEIVYKSKKESKGEINVYNYVLGGRFCEISKKEISDKVIKETTTYYRNSNVMSYRLHDNDNHLLYYRIYNEDGTSKQYDGVGVLFQDSISYITLQRGSRYMNKISLVNPPNCKVVVMIGVYRPEKLSNRDLNKYPIRMYDVQESAVNYEVSSDSVGIQRYQIYWAIEDTISGDIQKGKFIHQYSFITE